jgi:hypothetical protein
MATPFWDLGPGEKVGDKDGRVYVEFNPQLLTPWERVKIAGFDLPGRSTVISPGRVRKVQRNGGPGDEAEEIIDVGALAADVQIIVQVWTPEHLEQWDAFSDRMRDLFAEARDDTGKKSAPALDVDHPGLNLAGITSLFVYQVSVLQPSSIRGVMESTILATEYRSRKKAKTQSVAPLKASQSNLKLAPEIKAAASPRTPADTERDP